MIDNLIPLLKKYSAYDENGIIKLIRLGGDKDGGYIVPEKAIKEADALFGYGIGNNNAFEEDFSDKYNKPSYGFDCGVHGFKGKNPLFKFVEECVGTDESLAKGQVSSKKIISFASHLDRFQLHGKKVFIKMDIEGGEYKAFENILQSPNSITGLVFELHFSVDTTEINKAIKLLSSLKKDFVLLHVHPVNMYKESSAYYSTNAIGKFHRLFELTYINKALINTSELTKNQGHPTSLDMPLQSIKS